MEALTNSVLIGPIGLGELLVDDRHARRTVFVVDGEGSTVIDGNVQGIEVALVNDVGEQGIGILALRELVALGNDVGHVLVG